MYSSVNNVAHSLNMYPTLNNFSYFFNRTFVKKTKYPIISICLFIIVVVLNSIQYSKDDKKYLQKQVIDSNNQFNKKHIDKPNYGNILLYIYDIIGINGFMYRTPAYIFFFMVTYLFLSLVELNIGYLALLFLLFIDIMFITFWTIFRNTICKDILLAAVSRDDDGYCCGSFILLMAIGFVLYLIQKNIGFNRNNNIFVIIYFIILLTEKYYVFKDLPDGESKDCLVYNWHCSNYIFGVLCGAVLSN